MRVKHGACGASWWQSGNRTGHCSQCHRTFSGAAAFDRHQIYVDGKVVCLDPALAVDKDGRHIFTWTNGKHGFDSEVTYWRVNADLPDFGVIFGEDDAA